MYTRVKNKFVFKSRETEPFVTSFYIFNYNIITTTQKFK